jgi:hypothetical protein
MNCGSAPVKNAKREIDEREIRSTEQRVVYFFVGNIPRAYLPISRITDTNKTYLLI